MIKNKGLLQMLLVIGLMYLSNSAQAAYDGKYWVVKRGDTLYAVARFFHPNNSTAQAKLRKQIINLNQNVFAQGAKGMFIGLRLQLPNNIAMADPQSSTQTKKVTTAMAAKQTQSHKTLTGKAEWKIKRGDTLYSIARNFYPKSGRQRAQLRKQIMQLNPEIFDKGANKMKVGLILTMPAHLYRAAKPKTVVAKAKTKPTQTKQQTKPQTNNTSRQKTVDTVQKSEPAREISTSTKNNSSYSDAHYLLSLGYSFGGDVALIASGGHDISYGSGVHLRIARDSYWQREQGYRLALGGQYDQVTAGSDSGQMQQLYLQALYLYRVRQTVLGVGLAYHTGIHFESDISSTITEANYDDAIGTVFSIEYQLTPNRTRIGLSHTQLESEYENSQVTVDMTRSEIYYSWQF